MNGKQLREQAKAAYDRAAALLGKIQKADDLTPELQKQIEGAQGEFDRLNALAVTTEQIEAKGADYVQGAGGIGGAAFAGWRPSTPDEGNVEFDGRSWREAEVKTAFGRTITIRYNVPLAVQKKGYAGAFEAYLRKSFMDLGPQDRKTLSEGTDTAGGFLAPEQFQAELIKKQAANAAIRPLARVVSTGRDVVKWPRVNYSTDNKYTSGVRLSWVGELPSANTAHRVTDPVFGLVSLPVHTAMASMPVSKDLIEDAAFDVLGMGAEMMAEAFTLGEDDAFINGTGVAQPRGLFDGIGTTNRVGYQASGTSAAIATSGDAHNGKRVLDVYYAVPAQYRSAPNAAWVMNSATLKAVENLVDAQKRPLARDLLTGSLENGEPVVVKGKRISVDEFVPDIGADTFPLMFGDVRGYFIVDRVGFSVQRFDDSAYAELNLSLLLARKRVGGDVVEPYRLQAMKAGTS